MKIDYEFIDKKMVVLSYYPNKRRRELLEIRIGSRKPDEEDMKLIS